MAINLNKLSEQSRKFKENLLRLNGSEKQIYSQRIVIEGLQKNDASSAIFDSDIRSTSVLKSINSSKTLK
jgi:hypothetical protein